MAAAIAAYDAKLREYDEARAKSQKPKKAKEWALARLAIALADAR